HEQLWERLGAHVREMEGVRGTAFAVWAPSARAVSVVGDFNYWDGRMHPLRSLGSSGIWELFLPGVAPGARYKYELIAPDGEIRLKADPVAFQTEVPPKTASVVRRLGLSGHALLRPDPAVRLAGRLQGRRGPAALARTRGDPRLGPGACPA